jgi:ABC-type uncharacterized transport system fused permease/ATPase subunit
MRAAVREAVRAHGAVPRRPGARVAGSVLNLGLVPFDQHHATVFSGRRALTERLLTRAGDGLAAGGWLLVAGPSGARKSSLLRG